jgi:hypothetical protein
MIMEKSCRILASCDPHNEALKSNTSYPQIAVRDSLRHNEYITHQSGEMAMHFSIPSASRMLIQCHKGISLHAIKDLRVSCCKDVFWMHPRIS